MDQVFVSVNCFEDNIFYLNIPTINLNLKVVNNVISTSRKSIDIVEKYSLFSIIQCQDNRNCYIKQLIDRKISKTSKVN